jgi:predicted O-methyltransferase YrrM
MNPGEQEVLLALLDQVTDLETMIEVGVNLGITAKAVLQHVPTIQRYIGIDVPFGYQFELPAQESERPATPGILVRRDPRFHLVLRGDRDPRFRLVEELPASCDAVFIDGDHGYQSVLQDSRWAAEIVRPTGMIIWHDYGNPTVEVTKALDQLHDEGRKLWHVEGTWIAFEWR